MEAEEGKRVRIRFICKLEDGTIYDIADRDTLEFVVGQRNTYPSLERGMLGMKPGEHRTIRVPGTEVAGFSFDEDEAPTEGHFPGGGTKPPKYGYDFGPGEGTGDDVYLTVPSTPARPLRERPPAGSDLLFEVEMISVEDAGR
jgi:FKBP-type peptidyl-prolyl cis-trans isomerase